MTLSPPASLGLVLPVRQYYVQTDSALPGQAHRMCFSSTCAMAVKYLRPGVLRFERRRHLPAHGAAVR